MKQSYCLAVELFIGSSANETAPAWYGPGLLRSRLGDATAWWSNRLLLAVLQVRQDQPERLGQPELLVLRSALPGQPGLKAWPEPARSSIAPAVCQQEPARCRLPASQCRGSAEGRRYRR